LIPEEKLGIIIKMTSSNFFMQNENVFNDEKRNRRDGSYVQIPFAVG